MDFLSFITGRFQFLSEISIFRSQMSLQPTMENSMFSPDISVSGGLNKLVLSVVGWYVYVEIAGADAINCVSSTTQSWAG